MKNKDFKNKIMKTLLFYNILFLIVSIVFISFIPKLLVYPPNSINTEFERHIDDGFLYNEQAVAIVIFALLASNVSFLMELRRVKGWEKYVDSSGQNEEKIEKIKRDCFKIPSRLYFFHVFVPTFATAVMLPLTRR